MTFGKVSTRGEDGTTPPNRTIADIGDIPPAGGELHEDAGDVAPSGETADGDVMGAIGSTKCPPDGFLALLSPGDSGGAGASI